MTEASTTPVEHSFRAWDDALRRVVRSGTANEGFTKIPVDVSRIPVRSDLTSLGLWATVVRILGWDDLTRLDVADVSLQD